MKEKTLLEMKNKIETLGKLYQQMTYDYARLQDVTIGTLELVKKLPGYEDALEEFKAESKEMKDLRKDLKNEALDKLHEMHPDQDVEFEWNESRLINTPKNIKKNVG